MRARNLIALVLFTTPVIAAAQPTHISGPLSGYQCGQECGYDPFCWFWLKMTCPPTVPDGFTSGQPLGIKEAQPKH
jgi:hypothetical protein